MKMEVDNASGEISELNSDQKGPIEVASTSQVLTISGKRNFSCKVDISVAKTSSAERNLRLLKRLNQIEQNFEQNLKSGKQNGFSIKSQESTPGFLTPVAISQNQENPEKHRDAQTPQNPQNFQNPQNPQNLKNSQNPQNSNSEYILNKNKISPVQNEVAAVPSQQKISASEQKKQQNTAATDRCHTQSQSQSSREHKTRTHSSLSTNKRPNRARQISASSDSASKSSASDKSSSSKGASLVFRHLNSTTTGKQVSRSKSMNDLAKIGEQQLKPSKGEVPKQIQAVCSNG